MVYLYRTHVAAEVLLGHLLLTLDVCIPEGGVDCACFMAPHV
jgi:hypothetical protein